MKAPKYSYSFLLVCQLAFLLLHPVTSGIMLNTLFSLILISSLYVLSRHRRDFFLGSIFAAPAFFSSWSSPIYPAFLPVAQACGAVFLGLLVVLMGRHVFFRKEKSFDLVFGSLCVYIMIGLLWTFLYNFIDTIEPDSFNTTDTLYFSFVTLTTLGYGDITPQTSLTRNLAMIEAIVGQFYIATLVASLIVTLTRSEPRPR